MNGYVIIPLAISFSLAIILYFVCLVTSRSYQKKGLIVPDEGRILRRLTYLYLTLELGLIITFILCSSFFPHDLLADSLEPVSLFINVTPVGILAFLIYRRLKTRSNHPGDTFNPDIAVREIFNSQSFYSAISTSLPVGKANQDYGFDYIPFMLQNLKEKRDRFRKSSNTFLWTTILLSLFFVSITIGLGYVLLNESSVGINRSFDKLKTQFTETDKSIQLLRIDLTEGKWKQIVFTGDFFKLEEPNKYLDGLEGKSYREAVSNIASSYSQLLHNGNFNEFFSTIEKGREELRHTKDRVSEEYSAALEKAYTHIVQIKQLRDKGISDIISTMSQAKDVLAKADKKLDEPLNTQNELIKRLVLSIVIVSFFIAILRWFRSLYQSHYHEMLRAENEDLMLRKFYVAYKSATSSDERRQVLTTLLTGSQQPAPSGKKSKESEDENAVLKDVINAMLKKL